MGVAADRRTCDPARWYQRRGAGFSLSPGHTIIKGSEGGRGSRGDGEEKIAETGGKPGWESSGSHRKKVSPGGGRNGSGQGA